MKVTGTADELRVQSYYEISSEHGRSIPLFADGAIWTSGEIETAYEPFIGVGADESFYGSAGDDTIRGMGE